MEANKLMDFASNYYATLVESNEWVPTKGEEEEDFIALRTHTAVTYFKIDTCLCDRDQGCIIVGPSAHESVVNESS